MGSARASVQQPDNVDRPLPRESGTSGLPTETSRLVGLQLDELEPTPPIRKTCAWTDGKPFGCGDDPDSSIGLSVCFPLSFFSASLFQ